VISVCIKKIAKNHKVFTLFSSPMKRVASSSTGAEKNAKSLKTSTLDAMSWKNHGNLVKGLSPMIYLDGPDTPPSSKIASFDMDQTLINTKRGKGFPTGPKDWVFDSPKIVPKLNALYKEGYKIIIFTNQAGMEKKKTKPEDIKTKILAVANKLGFAIQAFISTGENIYRKPSVHMWNFMRDKCNGGVPIDFDTSFYCGDAAGRAKGWAPGRNKDFSCSDRKFAANIGVKFCTPEELFNGAKPYSKFDWGSVNAEKVLNDSEKKSIEYIDVAKQETEMVIFVGSPASGKSTFAKRHFEKNGYMVINRDTLGTQDKCLKSAQNALNSEKSVIIDNTNPAKESRKAYIDIAKNAKVPVRCFHFETPLDLAKHMNMYRQLITSGKIRRVPDVGFNMYKSKFVQPELSEGFSELKKIEFVAKFDDVKDEETFKQWT